MRVCTWLTFCFALLASGLQPVMAEDAINGHARAVLAASAEAVVTIRCLVKSTFTMPGQNPGQNQAVEQKNEVNAITVDPSGMFVASAMQLSFSPYTPMQEDGTKMGAPPDITDINVLFPGGTEQPADLVLTDQDLDCAFIRLKDQSGHLPTIALSEAADACQLLDQVFILGRADKAQNRTPTLHLGLVSGLVTGPQPYYLADIAGETGCPAYNAEGKLLGLHLTIGHSYQQVIRPANQILELAKQALAAKPKGAPSP